MLSHEDYYNMKYILKDKKITLNIYQVHEFIDSLPSMNREKRLKKGLRFNNQRFGNGKLRSESIVYYIIV